MRMRAFPFLLALIPACSAANLVYSTYLRDGFTPTAIASDPQGNLYIAGSAVVDPAAGTSAAAALKLDPGASEYLYVTFLDSAASDHVSAIAVDTSGNAYLAGYTTNPGFPQVGGAQLGAAPANTGDQRSFVTKIGPNGNIVFSSLIGGSASSTAQGIALTPQGQIVVSGQTGAGFPSTPGAYSAPPPPSNQPGASSCFTTELDPTGSKVIFSATGIGGSAIAIGPTGNIYLAGSAIGTSYPTTPGAFQTTLFQTFYCFFLCQIAFPGGVQHVTALDPTGSKLLYSTGLNGAKFFGDGGSITTTGLAVDTAGNAYVTGSVLEGAYPFTVPYTYSLSTATTYFFSKIDPTGANLLFSVPFGGGGVQLDSSGSLFVSGNVANIHYGAPPLSLRPGPAPPPAVLSWIPLACWPNALTSTSGAYAIKVDPASGNALDAQWIDGASPAAIGLAVASGKTWIVGTSNFPDVPFTQGALSPGKLATGPLPGAFLSGVDFSQPPAPTANGGPVIACVLDAGNFMHAGPVAAYQILTIFGANLGPSTGVAAPDGSDPSIAGVTVTFDGNPAKMLYASSTQINVMVNSPPASRTTGPFPTQTVMQISYNGAAVERQIPLVEYNMNLFANPSQNQTTESYAVVANNADGSLNSRSNPAKFGSLISLFVDGVGGNQLGLPIPTEVNGIQAQVGYCSAAVENTALLYGMVYRVDVRLPDAQLPCVTSEFVPTGGATPGLTLSYQGAPVGPLAIPNGSGGLAGRSIPMAVYVTQ